MRRSGRSVLLCTVLLTIRFLLTAADTKGDECSTTVRGCSLSTNARTAFMDCGAPQLCQTGKGCVPDSSCAAARSRCDQNLDCEEEQVSQTPAALQCGSDKVVQYVAVTVKLSFSTGEQVICDYYWTKMTRAKALKRKLLDQDDSSKSSEAKVKKGKPLKRVVRPQPPGPTRRSQPIGRK